MDNGNGRGQLYRGPSQWNSMDNSNGRGRFGGQLYRGPSQWNSMDNSNGRGRFGGRGRGRGRGFGRTGGQEIEGVQKDSEKKPHPKTATVQVGVISTLKDNFGYITPLNKEEEGETQAVYFRFGDNSRTETGLLDIEVGDVLHYTLNANADRPRAMYSKLLQCTRRCPLALGHYLDKLLSLSAESPGKVLRQITRCPVGFLLVLELRRPPSSLVCSVLKLAEILQDEAAAFYSARLKQFYKFFCGAEFLISSDALEKYALDRCRDEDQMVLINNFMLRLVAQCPEILTDLLPLVQCMMESLEQDSAYCKFLVELLRCQAGLNTLNSSSEKMLAWDKMPLVPFSAEIGSGAKGTSTSWLFNEKMIRTSLPRVKKEGSYGSVDDYLDTYYQLLREDCFAPLRKGLSDFKADKLDHRDMKVWRKGSAIGVHFSRRNHGITIALTAERLDGKDQFPMPGTLLCICDEGGNFDCPIWGVVAKCEEDKQTRAIFVEIVDGRAGLGGASAQCMSRLLAPSDLVFAENPTFYKTYEPVMRALQQMDSLNFPFEEEFVYARWTHQPPRYLSERDTTVDWGCLFGESMVRSGIQDLDNLIQGGYQTTLDKSQLNAVKLALKNRLVLIQGPPGTGKTFVGVKILQILLSADTLPPGPVLVVTYKNQGLDHFLLSCLDFCKEGLVRVGGRSREPSLDKFNLFSLLPKGDEFTPDCYENAKKLEEAQPEVEEALKELQASYAFNLERAVQCMSDMQLRQLILGGKHGDPDLVPEEGISLANFLGWDSPKSKKLYQVISNTLKDWIPKKETFQMVGQCFSRQKVSRALKQAATRSSEDDGSYDLDEEDNDTGNVLKEQFLGAKREEEDEGYGGKKSDCGWLKDNFFSYKPQAFDAFYSDMSLSTDIDVERYCSLLDENPWDLNESHRVILIHLIMQTRREKAVKRLEDAKKAYNEICRDMEEISKRRQLEVLKKARIVGMTTTGAALNQEILKSLNPSIVFVEEAAEVLEPQLLAVLGPSVQHLILIGDHHQLSPSVEVYELKIKHDFSVSLFERLVEHNKMPFQTLASQSRMREEFVPMILPIYPKLRTNIQFVSGERNTAPKCMASPMYFWSHSHEETKERSCDNNGEANMVFALVQWMIAEGQRPEEITVLAAYNGQVKLLREMLKRIPNIEALQVLTIDRFQGSENKVIILSLVRGNEKGNIGFLAERNRLCVAVSRARGAMYFCGDDTTLTKMSAHWRTLLGYLSHKNCVGNTIHLCCPRHPHSPSFPISSDSVDDFDPRLCKRRCNTQLHCGHYCESTCHFGDHPKCSEPVQFTFSICRHQATKKCSEDEKKKSCQQELMHTFELCGHKKSVKCWETVEKKLICHEPCRNILKCGHPCRLRCYEICEANSCQTCIEIQKLHAQKQKQLEASQLRMKLTEIKAELKRLEDSLDGQETLMTNISPTGESAAEYFQVMDRTEKFIQPGHDVLLVVTRIQKVFNPKLQINFLKAQRDLFKPASATLQLFHGTDDAGVEGIIQNGFKLPEANKRNMFGQGCYFATDSTKSAQEIYTKGSNKLLLCEVLIGRSWMVQEDQPEMDLKKIKKKGYDSVFSKRGGRGTGGTLYDEYVIYNPHQALPRYIVHYKNQHDPQALKAHEFQNNLTRILYESSSTFSGDNPGEYHFRQAESQFYRMSSRHDQKVVKVELIFNKSLQKRYDSARQKLEENSIKLQQMFVFHGTDQSAIENIIREGFRIGGQGVSVRNGSVYGTGVYTALDPDISVGYSGGSGMMLLSLALVGQEGGHYNKGGSPDVFVIKDADYLLPRYIVHFKNR